MLGDVTAADLGPRLIFVGGMHRSGTTPLASALAEHPDISGLTGTGVLEDEGQHLQDVYPVASTYGGPGRFALDPRSHLTESSALVAPDAAERLVRAWSPYWRSDSRLFVEKSPPNIVMGRFLQEVFPGSALVVVVRHPVTVALATVKWRRLLSRHPQNAASVEMMVRNWVRAHETLLEDLHHLHRVRVLRYEDLVERPRETLAQVADLVGLDTPVPDSSLVAHRSSEYELRWQAMDRTPWGRHQRRQVVQRYGELAGRFGYDLDTMGHSGRFELDVPRA